MSILSLLSGAKPRTTAPAGKPLQAAVRKQITAPSQPPKAPTVVLPPPRQRPEVKPSAPAYKSTSELPAYRAVVSLEGGRFQLSSQQRQHMFVLEIDGEKDTYCLVATREFFGSAPYAAAEDRIRSAGCRLKGCGTADGALVQAVNKVAHGEDSKDDANLVPIVREIHTLSEAALAKDVSDIHIESRDTYALVRMRVNGRLELYSDSWTPEYVGRLARALHTLADDDSKSTTFKDDTQMSVSMELPSGAKVKLRVQLSPAYPSGRDIVIRLLRVAAAAKVKTLESLGYAPDHIEMLEYMQASPHGLIVIAGTTGSGKSTTLQTVMQNIRKANPDQKLITIEDPPEYVMDGVTQIPVARNGKDNPFVAAMRNTMRMDPDVIMVGEIRDMESAVLMVAMEQSGHKALTTIHTESALGIITRLKSFGVDSDVLGNRTFISGLIFQTLVPTLCRHCRIDYAPEMPEVSEALHDRIRGVMREGDTLFIESSSGCEHCNHTGIAGRSVCAEMVIPDDRMRELIHANDMRGAYEYWRAQRKGKGDDSMLGATALEHAILKMRRGDVSPAAVEGALGLLHDFGRDMEIAESAGDLLGLSS